MNSDMERVSSAYQQLMEQQASTRRTLEYFDNDLFPGGGPKEKSLIEISGASNSGKSLILQMIMRGCLPPTYFGGRYCDVIFLDPGHKFELAPFVSSILNMVRTSSRGCPPSEEENVVQNCLESLIHIPCFSSEELDLAFYDVEEILLENRNVALVAVDGLDAFYWLDVQKRPIRMSTHYAKSVTRLRRLCDEHKVCCAFTVDANYLETKTPTITTTTTNVVTTMPMPSAPPQVDYRIKLSLMADGTRTLNDGVITIDDNGLQFVPCH